MRAELRSAEARRSWPAQQQRRHSTAAHSTHHITAHRNLIVTAPTHLATASRLIIPAARQPHRPLRPPSAHSRSLRRPSTPACASLAATPLIACVTCRGLTVRLVRQHALRSSGPPAGLLLPPFSQPSHPPCLLLPRLWITSSPTIISTVLGPLLTTADLLAVLSCSWDTRRLLLSPAVWRQLVVRFFPPLPSSSSLRLPSWVRCGADGEHGACWGASETFIFSPTWLIHCSTRSFFSNLRRVCIPGVGSSSASNTACRSPALASARWRPCGSSVGCLRGCRQLHLRDLQPLATLPRWLRCAWSWPAARQHAAKAQGNGRGGTNGSEARRGGQGEGGRGRLAGRQRR